jgi:uncharacterized protein YdeI (YjbR/CyaY-like superfamily)
MKSPPIIIPQMAICCRQIKPAVSPAIDRIRAVRHFPAMALQRDINPMPKEVRDALAERGLMQAYEARPPYQRNDYLGWIARAKLPETRRKRLDQILEELERGGVYMNMKWNG